MKKVALISAIALGSLFYNNVNAQVLQIGVRLGGGRPVVQASIATPVVAVNYSNADQYYYMPEIDAYYSVYERSYYYNDGIRWVSAAYLPGAYRNYDWRTARYYEVRAHRPYMNANVYRERYSGRVYNQWDRRDNRFDNRNDRREVRFDNRNDRRDNRFDNRNDRRDDNLRFEKRNDNDNRGRGNDRNDNRPQGNWGGGNNQPQQPGRGNGNVGRPEQGRGGNQPARQGQSRGGSNEHFANNNQNHGRFGS